MLLLNLYGVDMSTSGLIVQAQSREKIFADKLVAFALRPNRIRNSNLWDIAWLHQEAKEIWKALATGLVVGSVCASATAFALAKYLGASQATLLSLLPKSVTAPIAMGISESIGSIPTLSAVFCILTGIIGAASGKVIFDAIGIKDMAIRGFALGAQAHGIGTARAYFVSQDAGAFAGLAMGLHGLIAAILMPYLFR
jgi:putative effector of murein hydrolase